MTDLLFFIGACSIVAGCYLLSLPAALIVAGALIAAFAVTLERGSDQPRGDQ